MIKVTLLFNGKVLKEVKVGNGEITIGRSNDNDIQIENLGVSRHHARIKKEDGKLIVEDLKSTNGTFINNKPISRQALKDKDMIIIGKHTLKISIGRIHNSPSGLNIKAENIEKTMGFDTKQYRNMLDKLEKWPGFPTNDT